MDILDVLKVEACASSLKARSKEDCLKKLAGLLAEGAPSAREQDILNCLKEREKIGSTAFEDGIAIPHGKIKGMEEFVMGIAIAPRGIHFESVDGKKTNIFFVVVGPDEDDSAKEHLQILAQISRISRLPKARRELLAAPTPFVVKEVFTRFLSDTGMNGAPKGNDKLLFIILYEMRYLEDILDIFLERGIRGATTIESTGIRDDLSNIPLFSNFFNFLGEKSDHSKTIMTMVKESEVKGIVSEIEDRMGDLDNHTGAMIMALDVSFIKGSMEL